MATIIGYDEYGQPIIDYTKTASPSTIDPATGLPRPVGAPGVPNSTLIPGTNTQRPVDPASIVRAGIGTQIQGTIQDSRFQNKQLTDALFGGLGNLQGEINNANFIDQNAINSLWSGQQQARQGYANVAGNVRQNANNANNLEAALFGGYAGANQGLINDYSAGLTNYLNSTAGLMNPLSARSSDPADLARQLGSYNQLQGIAGGSLDYQAALAQAVLAQTQTYASDPADVARQQQMFSTLLGIGGGSLDYTADQWTSNPEDVANQKNALNIINSRTDVTPTAQEALLYELNRRQRESDEQSSRAAVLDNLAARGLKSGGAQLAMLQQGGQQRSQDRVLADMIANAQAVERARQYTDMSAQLSTAIRGQSDAVGTFNVGQANNAKANNQSTRYAGYAGAANQSNAIRDANDRVGMFNTSEINTTNRLNASLQTQTNQFNAGQINTARANNQATRLSGAQSSALQANAIRSANDSQRQYEDTYAQNEAIRVGNLAGQRAQETRLSTDAKAGRIDSTYDAGTKANQSIYERTDHADATDWDVVGKNYGLDQDFYDAVTGAGDRRVGRALGGVGAIGNAATIQSNLKSTDIDNLIRSLDLSEAERAGIRTRSSLGL